MSTMLAARVKDETAAEVRRLAEENEKLISDVLDDLWALAGEKLEALYREQQAIFENHRAAQ